MAGTTSEMQVRWSELRELIQGKKVALLAPDGVQIEGKATEVTSDSLIMRIEKTTDASTYPKGPAAIPRSAVSVIQFRTIEGKSRLLGAAALAGAGMLGGWATAEGVYYVSGEGEGVWHEPEGVDLILGVGGGAGALGYLLGRNADKREVYLKIVP
jgi:hypothetical protein